MQTALIAPYSDISAIGVRVLSSILKNQGHAVRMILLPYQVSEIEYTPDFVFRYDQSTLDHVYELVKDCKVIGISLMTNYLEHAVDLTEYLRKRKVMGIIIWGGIHPTLSPEDCLGFTDGICLGEADEAFPELLTLLETGKNISKIKNFYFRANGKIIRNELRSPVQDLDKLPFQDYNLYDDWVLNSRENRLDRMTPEILEKYLTRGSATKKRGLLFYQTITSRGCPYKCAFCCWSKIKEIQPDCKKLRRRSPANVISELEGVLKKYPFFKEITFSDDSFFGSPIKYIREFSDLYKKKINLPFQCLAGPTTITEEKMAAFVDAGMKNIQIGMQTASERILNLYNRPTTVEKMKETTRIVHKYIPKIHPPIYDFILDNPYEKKEEIIETLRFIQGITQPFFLQIFSIVFFPGTKLYEMAVKDKLIKDPIKDIIHKQYNLREINYLNILFSFLGHGYPKWLTGFLLNPIMIKILDNNIFNSLYRLTYMLYRKIFLILRKVGG
ncbi:B12-binding domain-containing radical SAM protein [bacterium]|nr:B12-binding domain-containing radical SAM protein [bacterium]